MICQPSVSKFITLIPNHYTRITTVKFMPQVYSTCHQIKPNLKDPSHHINHNLSTNGGSAILVYTTITTESRQIRLLSAELPNLYAPTILMERLEDSHLSSVKHPSLNHWETQLLSEPLAWATNQY